MFSYKCVLNTDLYQPLYQSKDRAFFCWFLYKLIQQGWSDRLWWGQGFIIHPFKNLRQASTHGCRVWQVTAVSPHKGLMSPPACPRPICVHLLYTDLARRVRPAVWQNPVWTLFMLRSSLDSVHRLFLSVNRNNASDYTAGTRVKYMSPLRIWLTMVNLFSTQVVNCQRSCTRVTHRLVLVLAQSGGIQYGCVTRTLKCLSGS